MARERIPLRYGVRSDHLLSLLYLSPAALAHWKLLGFLSSYFLVKYQTLAQHLEVRLCRICSRVCPLYDCFTVLPLRGSIESGAALMQGQKVTTRGYHIICYHLKIIRASCYMYVGRLLQEDLSNSSMQTAQCDSQRKTE